MTVHRKNRVARQASWSRNSENHLFATKSMRHTTIYNSWKASFGVSSIRIQVVPGMTGSTHPYQLAFPIQAFFVENVNLLKSKVAAGLRSATSRSSHNDTVLDINRANNACWGGAKTPWLDWFWTPALNECDSEYSIIISHNAHRLFAVGRFSSMWMTGLVSPLLKKPGLPRPTSTITFSDNKFLDYRRLSSDSR